MKETRCETADLIQIIRSDQIEIKINFHETSWDF